MRALPPRKDLAEIFGLSMITISSGCARAWNAASGVTSSDTLLIGEKVDLHARSGGNVAQHLPGKERRREPALCR
jgi:hypothetical protein